MGASLVRLPARRGKREPLGSGRAPRVALLGAPNVGKTSLFNRLARTNLRVGNYPGVTVEGTTARWQADGLGPVELTDLPGTVSLCGRGAEERIAVHALLGTAGHEAPDAVLVVLDGTQLERHLYLALQVVELGLPTVVLLNMADEARDQGVDVDVPALSAWLGVPCLAISARTGEGIEALPGRLRRVLSHPDAGRSARGPVIPEPLREAASELGDLLAQSAFGPTDPDDKLRRALGLWALMSVEDGEDEDAPPRVVRGVEALREKLEADGVDVDAAVVSARYAVIDEALSGFLSRRDPNSRAVSDRIDAVLVHPAWGFVLFIAMMTALFQGLFSWSDPAIGLVEAMVESLAVAGRAVLPDGLLEDFLMDGVVAGVGSVLVFLPQILLLFLLIGIMEDSGYMARVAYLMDRVMRAVGLHGRAFVPMLSGFACAVPAILATRTMERKRDRLLTMLVVPLMTCSARLPVYTLIIAALFPPERFGGGLPVQGGLMAAMYLFSIATALIAAAVLGRTIVRGRQEPLILELPPYRLPRTGTVLRMMWDRSRVFLTEAGSVILICTVVLWALLAFPKLPASEFAALEASGEAAATVELHQSYGARLGRAIEPVIEPLGFDWKIGVGLIGAFAAREVFVATMGVVYGVGDQVDEESVTLRGRIRAESNAQGEPIYTPLVGLSLMVFFALAAQCMSTLAAVKRETRTWRWPAFLFAYMTGLAWLASFVVYQGGLALGWG